MLKTCAVLSVLLGFSSAMAHWKGLEKYYTALLSNSKKAQLFEPFIFLMKKTSPGRLPKSRAASDFLGMTLKLKHVAVYLITIGSFYYIASVIEREK